jgi:hypothetical protein
MSDHGLHIEIIILSDGLICHSHRLCKEVQIVYRLLPTACTYTANVLSAESTDECLRTKSENNKQ